MQKTLRQGAKRLCIGAIYISASVIVAILVLVAVPLALASNIMRATTSRLPLAPHCALTRETSILLALGAIAGFQGTLGRIVSRLSKSLDKMLSISSRDRNQKSK